MINKNSKIFVAGHNGLIGSAIIRKLKNLNFQNIFTKPKNKLDLRDQKKVLNYFKLIKPDAVILAAAKVGGLKQIIDIEGNLFMITFRYKIVLFIQVIKVV